MKITDREMQAADTDRYSASYSNQCRGGDLEQPLAQGRFVFDHDRDLRHAGTQI